MRSVLAALLLLVGCRRSVAIPEHAIVATMEVPDAGAEVGPEPAPALVDKMWDSESALPEELRVAPPFGNDVKRTTCGTREVCRVLRERPAGKRDGRSLSVVVLELDKWDMDRREYWVLARSGGTIVARARIASEDVVAGKDGDGSLTVGDNTLTTRLTWWPTSNWQSWPERTFQLWPPRMTAFTDMPHHRGGADVFGTNSLGLNDGSGVGQYRCDDGRHADYLPIPEAARDPGLDPAKGLGRCAVIADGTKDHGYLLSGASDRASAYFRVAELDALYLEVHDDRWTNGDSIELHLGRPAGFMQCNLEVTPAKTYVIDPGGIVKTPAAGAPPFAVTLLRSDATTRVFRIALSDDLYGGITIVQRDDDGDGKPVRSIATSPLNTSPELGDTTHTRAACALTEDGPALVPVIER